MQCVRGERLSRFGKAGGEHQKSDPSLAVMNLYVLVLMIAKFEDPVLRRKDSQHEGAGQEKDEGNHR